MAEDLLPDDVEQYTKGRLSADDPEVERALKAALARMRNFCGWHVTPVRSDTLVVDGRGTSMLILPTLKIVSLTEITEDGELVDLDGVQRSGEAPGAIRKVCGYWNCGFGNVEVQLSHGFTADEAADFREAALQLVDQASLMVGTGGSGPLTEKEIDDVTYRWSGMVDRAWGIAKNPLAESVLYQYRLPIIA